MYVCLYNMYVLYVYVCMYLCMYDIEYFYMYVCRIEPITITARHPFGFGRCRDMFRKEYSQYFKRNVPRAG